MRNRTEKKNIAAIAFAAISFMWIMHTVTKNFVTDPEFLKLISLKDTFAADRSLWLFMLRAHILLAVISLLTGPIGVMRRLRMKSNVLHRWNGRIYVLSILLNFIPGLYVSCFATGVLAVAGFFVLNILWLATTWLGYIHIRRKNIAEHKRWITRSFFLTYANLSIHLLTPIGQYGFRFPYEIAYAFAVWGSMLLNVTLAELAFRKKWIKS